MLLSPFGSPRRLAVVTILVFLAIVVLVRNSTYSEYLPKYDLPKFTNGRVPEDTTTGSSSFKEDSGKSELWQEYKADQDKIHAAPPPPLKEEEYEEKPVHTTIVTTSHSSSSSSTSASVASSSDSVSTSATKTGTTAKITPFVHASYKELQAKIKEFIQWDRPNKGSHWPGYGDYVDKDYDPNRWEGLPMNVDYYASNGINQLEKMGLNATPYLPYPDYQSTEYKKHWTGEYVSCKGPRGQTLDKSPEDLVHAWPQLPQNFPNISVGSDLGIDLNSCFDRESRYTPYDSTAKNAPDWGSVRWGELQNDCLSKNKERYGEHQRKSMQLRPSRTMPKEDESTQHAESTNAAKPHHRTAILIRTWEGYVYTENDLQAIRSLVTETSLLSGGEYQVYLFVNVKQRDADIYDNEETYNSVLHAVVPEELRDISVLWTEKVCEEWYPKVGDWQVYWMQFMPLQWFSKTHPEFDYVWNWETDARYTGNPYHFLEQVSFFAQKMPRKHLWERNARFYLPEAHGDFQSYLADTDGAIANATKQGNMTPVWGALPYASTQIPIGPKPPTRQEDDDFSWGVGEEADLITLQPIWDPNDTQWSYRHKIWNFIPGVRPIFTAENGAAEGFYHEGFETIPRRVFINTLARFSKRMLHAMHVENLNGRSMQAEMWPATVALQHGLKAVYAPHPIWSSHHWPAWYADAIFNADAGIPARWSQQFDSAYAHDREVNFKTWSWYYATDFPKILFWRWLGWEAEDGGLGSWGGKQDENEGKDIRGIGMVGGQGKMCLPGMLLHPVKKVSKPQGQN
ncbi:hypothetical protein D6C93_09875 [Aureobasidium pullulans]|nr:hypothetical protein D6C93_09875 [Aureobasidium pullulans]